MVVDGMEDMGGGKIRFTVCLHLEEMIEAGHDTGLGVGAFTGNFVLTELPGGERQMMATMATMDAAIWVSGRFGELRQAERQREKHRRKSRPRRRPSTMPNLDGRTPS